MHALATPVSTELADRGTPPVLYLWGISPYCYKVQMAAAFKGVSLESRICSAPTLMEARRRTGHRKVPVIAAEEGWVSDSTRILAWLEERGTGPSLYPSDAQARAACDLLEDWADEALAHAVEPWIWLGDGRLNRLNALCAAEQTHRPSAWLMRLLRPLQRRSWTSRAERYGGVEATRAVVRDQLDLLEARLADRPWLFGDQPSAADFAVAGQLANLLRFDCAADLEARPRVAAMVRRAIGFLPDPTLFGV